jgi:hypothetical protein
MLTRLPILSCNSAFKSISPISMICSRWIVVSQTGGLVRRHWEATRDHQQQLFALVHLALHELDDPVLTPEPFQEGNLVDKRRVGFMIV